MIYGESLEVDVASWPELRLHRSGDVDRTLQTQILHSVLDDRELDCDLASNLDRAAETDFAIALGEMQIPDGEFGSLNVDRQVDLATSRQILDVAVTSMLRSVNAAVNKYP